MSNDHILKHLRDRNTHSQRRKPKHMNTGQTMLALGAMAMLMTVCYNWYSSAATSQFTINRAKCDLAASSIATSLIEEASGKVFDLQAVDTVATSVSKLTAPSGLGPANGEVYPNFNDFDDFNNLSLKLFQGLPDTFYVTAKVGYINPSDPSTIVNTQTWHKKLSVAVTSKWMQKDTVKAEYIFSYWYFR